MKPNVVGAMAALLTCSVWANNGQTVVESGNLRKGRAWPAARQLTICTEIVPGNLAIQTGAMAVTSSIFAGIDVKIRWRGPHNCPGEAIYISFSISTPVDEHRGALGYALPFEGSHIVVFLDRVKDGGRLDPSSACWLLGYTLAHEVTHLLEGQVRHSESGIMKPRWGADDYVEMKQTRLQFAAQDVNLIYHALEWRESNQRQSRLKSAATKTRAVRP